MRTFALRRYEPLWAPTLAAALAALAAVAAVRGVDLAAALYRVELFRSSGLTLWDNQWYGGHWTLNYSTLFPPAASLLGLRTISVGGAALAAWAFDRLVVEHWGSRARIGSLVFALGTLATVARAQLPFLMGESLALAALLMTRRGHTWRALVLALASSLASPLAGAFLGLASVALLIAQWPRGRRRNAAVGGAALAPVMVTTLLFPGQGAMGFPFLDFGSLGGLVAIGALLIPARDRTLRIGTALYLVAVLVCFAVPSAVGGNIARLGECVGPALLVCVLRTRPSPIPGRRAGAIAAAVVVSLLGALQWGEALPAVFGAGDLSGNRAYFQPLLSFLDHSGNMPARVEVVPTKWHWEAAYVAPSAPLARGWERQLDTADNPIFYAPGQLTAAVYRQWLVDNGVRYVALPDVPLDYAALAEARLVRAGVPGLRAVWHDAHWRVFAVQGSPGLVSGAARMVDYDASTVSLQVRRPGPVVVRVRYSSRWKVSSGAACTQPAAGGWLGLDVQAAGRVKLGVSAFAAGSSACPTPGA